MKVFLGREADFENSEDIIMRCIKNAYRDMLTAGRFYIESNIEENCRVMKKLLERHRYVFSEKLIDEAALIFGKNEIIGKGQKYVTRFGLAQKFVNMCFKNFYVCDEYTDKIIDFSKCHCPLDSVILEKICYEGTWSKLTKEKYIECQKRISDLLKKEENSSESEKLGNLAFDFIAW